MATRGNDFVIGADIDFMANVQRVSRTINGFRIERINQSWKFRLEFLA